MRRFISFRGPAGTRFGVSTGPADQRLPRWKRFEVRKAIEAQATTKGQHFTREEEDYIIDKAVAEGPPRHIPWGWILAALVAFAVITALMH